jgi:hypothetical protein
MEKIRNKKNKGEIKKNIEKLGLKDEIENK